MVDVTEILQHWYAGRPKVEVARSLGVDAKTVRKYVAPAEAGRDGPGWTAGERGAVAGDGPGLVPGAGRHHAAAAVECRVEKPAVHFAGRQPAGLVRRVDLEGTVAE